MIFAGGGGKGRREGEVHGEIREGRGREAEVVMVRV